VTIHDLAYFRMNVHSAGENAQMRIWTRRALDWAAAVIALSENTRQDLEAMGVPPQRIQVIYGGGHVVPDSQIEFGRIAELKRCFNLPDSYILFVGTLQPRKNVPFLVRSFAHLKKVSGLPHKLVLAGHRGTAGAEVLELAQTLGIAAEVLVTGYVDDWQLPLLYKLADIFVLPTLYEGFTLVTLEAMAYGTPVIATDTSSIREGVGNAAHLVQVNNVEELAGALHTVLTDQSIRARMIEQGKAQARLFTWERCADRTLKLYQQVCNNAEQRRKGTRSDFPGAAVRV
jgi:glycosyltransferase involved in cell wall biosynthesis